MLALTLSLLAWLQHPLVALEQAVDEPTPVARRAAADRLAELDVPLEYWLEGMRSFGSFEGSRQGLWTETVRLWVGGDVFEETELVLYVPTAYDPEVAAPLILALHGAGGRGQDLVGLWRAVAEELGAILVCPTQAGRNQGYGFSERERLGGLGALRWARRRFHVDEDRVHLTGVSRGGHMAWDLGLRHPDRFATLAPMIGGPRIQIQGGQNNLRYLENALHLRVRDLQGSKDSGRLLVNLRFAFARLREWNVDAELIEFPEQGHSFTFGAVSWPAFLGASTRERKPGRVVRAATGVATGRSRWLEITAVNDDVQVVFEPRLSPRFQSWSDEKQTVAWQEAVDERTARLAVERTGLGRYQAKGRGVRSFRLLLEREDLPEKGQVRVKFDRSRTYGVEPDVRVLLREFVERFDRRFLPVAEVLVE